MSRSIAEFQFPEGITLQQLETSLADMYSFHEEPDSLLKHTFLESFDWRLYQAGVVMEFTCKGNSRELSWRTRSNSEPVHRLLIDKAPVFYQDLPEGEFRSDLEQTLEVRALQPLVQVESRLQTVRVLGDENKTVVYLELEHGRCSGGEGGFGLSGEIETRIYLVPVRGYDDDYDHIVHTLKPLLRKVECSLFERAIQVLGLAPGGYTSKLNYRLDGGTRSDQAAKEILLGLLHTLEANIDGAQRNVDSEFLHDLRVATRRIRSALSQIKGVFPLAVVEYYKAGFAWLGQITGPTRDMDVYLLALDDYKQELPPLLAEALEPLRGFLERHHANEQKKLSQHFNSVRFRSLLSEWRAFLEQPTSDWTLAPNAARPVREVADERIWKMYRRVLKEGRAIGDSSPPEELHELRKSCKKLRYLLEFFQSLYPSKRVNALVKVLKALLDNLGNFQDMEVQAHSLRNLAAQVMQEHEVGADTMLAMGALIGALDRKQWEARKHFARVFADFDTPGHRDQFKALFRTGNVV